MVLLDLILSRSEFIGGKKETEEKSDGERLGLVHVKRNEKKKEIINEKEEGGSWYWETANNYWS